MGLEAALLCAARGLDVTVLEADEVGASLRRWGPTKAFSPLAMNVSARARALVAASSGTLDDAALLTGPELVERVLVPLARSAPLGGRVRAGHRVVSVGRARMRRDELPGHPLRGERAFRLLVDTPEGERVFEADAVLDASGVYGQPLPLGAGGVPAVGERALGGRVVRRLGELHARLDALAGRRVLLVGHGHSAAHAVALLAERAGTLVWATRAPNRAAGGRRGGRSAAGARGDRGARQRPRGGAAGERED